MASTTRQGDGRGVCSSAPAPQWPRERALHEGAKDELSGGGKGAQRAEV
jgi:hypothetical protein